MATGAAAEGLGHDDARGLVAHTRKLLEQLGPTTLTAHILNPFLSVEELLRDVLVDVEEADTTTIDYGGGLEVGRIFESDADGASEDLDIGYRGFLGVSRRNLWGKNRSVTLFGRITLRQDTDDGTGQPLVLLYGAFSAIGTSF